MVHAQPDQPRSGSRWTAIVPLRSFATGKSRLRSQLADEAVEAVAREVAAGLLDQLAGCAAIGRIMVVSDADLSEDLAAGTQTDRVETLVQSPGGGLNEAVTEAAALIWTEDPESLLLVIHADLPYATTAELEHLLAEVETLGADTFVADHTGRGSTAVALLPGSSRRTAFGPDSAARHAARGFTEAELPRLSGLRHDLDTPEHYATYRRHADTPSSADLSL